MPDTALLSVSVLIPAHNEAAVIADVIRSIQRSDYPIQEIVVVSDASSDGTADVARSMGARVIETEFRDKAKAQNVAVFGDPVSGIPPIQSDLIAGFDGDTEATPECISKMVEDIEKGADATCATILPIQPKGFFIRARRFAYALGRRWWRLAQAKVGRIQVLTGAVYLFRTDAIRSVGGFPSFDCVSQDMPMTWLFHQRGYRCAYSAAAVAYTYDPETFQVYTQQMQRWAAGYFQSMSIFKRELLNWRAMLVVGTAIFDLICLALSEVFVIWHLFVGHYRYFAVVAVWVALHAVITTTLVATVVGLKEAVLGVVPYTVVNILNKWIYFVAMIREWILGKHWTTWSGRQGRRGKTTAMTTRRKIGLAISGSGLLVGLSLVRTLG